MQKKETKDKEVCKEQRVKVKRINRQKKRTFMEHKVTKIEDHYKRKEVRHFYRETRRGKKTYNSNVFIKNKEGNLIGGEDQMKGRWKEYDFLNGDSEEEVEQEVREGNKEIVESTRAEVEEILGSMKNNKSPGQNGITIENIKYGCEQLRQEIYELIIDIWKKEEMSEGWEIALFIPILKSGDKTYCNSYIGISLLDIVYKILATVIRTKLEAVVDLLIGKYQAGFRKGRGTTDQLFIMKEVWTTCAICRYYGSIRFGETK